MNYERFVEVLQHQFEAVVPLMPAQRERIILLCRAIFLTARIHLSFLARCLPKQIQQDSRIRWIRRLLEAKFMSQELVYQPILTTSLAELRLDEWHLIIDRTNLVVDKVDLVTISLHYHRRAVPLIWRQIPYGGVALSEYVSLVQECAKLIPKKAQVIFHGDVEFGGAKMIRALRLLRWHFSLAQRQHVHIWLKGKQTSQALSTLPVTAKHSVRLAHLDLFARERIGDIQIVAFEKREYDKDGRLRREVCYLATSLSLHRNIRRLGARRWGIEPFHRDLKSSGWQIDQSLIQRDGQRAGLLIVLAVCYLLSVCIGRWLCKTGNRFYIDNHPKRQLSLFRLGWDLIVNYINCELDVPFRLILYS